MTNTASKAFDLQPAQRIDIPRLAHIHVVACLPDNAFKLYFSDPKEFNKRVVDMLEHQVGDPNWQHVKVVDKETSVIAAWASWNTPTDVEIGERDMKAAAKVAATKLGLGAGAFGTRPDYLVPYPTLLYFLFVYVQADTEKWLERYTQGQRHIQCKALFTEPPYEKRGMGSALVASGNELADKAGLPIFLQGPPYGYPIYAKHGFETVQVLDVDLREWAPRADGNDKGFGNYRFRYMMRLPRTLPEV